MIKNVEFSDKSVPYQIFIKDLATEIVKQMKDSKEDKENISQRQAFLIFGRANVERWRKLGLTNPVKRGGKIEYSSKELRYCQNKNL